MTFLSSRERIARPFAFAPGFAMLAALVAAAPAGAQTVTSIEADLGVIASDNPFLLDGGDTEALALEFAVRPELRLQPGPTTFVEIDGEAAYRRYLRRYGDFVTGHADAVVRHRASDFLSADARLSYARELPIDALTDSIDFAVDPNSVRQRISGRTTATLTVSARDRMTLGAGFDRIRYARPSPLSSTRSWHVDAEWTRRLTERLRAGLMATATNTNISGVGNLSGIGVRAVAEYRFSSTLEARGQLGVEWTRYQITDGQRRARLSGSGNVCYRPQRIEACVTASLQNEVSGIGGLQRETFVGGTFRYRINESSSVTALGEYRAADLTGPVIAAARTNATRLGAGYERRISQRLTLTGNVDYLRRAYLSGNRADGFAVRIGVTLTGDRR
ncbi:hypothetical protein [Sphingomonas sp. AX6]|uniref:hypothetical protein n=1 Tax=Sphingomonas sp. AX6 TaxID=2653171 RepID=UPI001F3F270B|nr:hypothetical protein [Sphingomonas sp. AX6]